MANLSPFGPQLQYEDSAGEPAVGYRLFFFVNNSVGTKQDTYTTAAGTVANANPIVLNALGQPANGIFFPAGQAYTIQYAPPGSDDPPNSPIWTRNDVYGVNDVTATQDQWVASGVVPTYVSATSFTLPGDQTSTFQVGRRVKTTNSGGTVYSTIIGSAYAALTTVTVVNDSGTLDSGLSAVSYGLLSASSQSLPPLGTVVPLSSVSGTNTITASATVTAAGLRTGQAFAFVPANTNTGATTLNINSIGAKNVYAGNSALVGGELHANIPVTVFYDGTRFQLLGPTFKQPTRTVLTTGTAATYTTPVGATRILVQMVGGGGGGGAQTANNGSNGTASTFTDGTLSLSAGLGGGGSAGGQGGVSTASSGGDINVRGQAGGTVSSNGGAPVGGGYGGNSIWGGGGRSVVNLAGEDAEASSGGGGAGAGAASSTAVGGGGASGSYCEKLIVGPSASYTYTVGAGGNGGAAGGLKGGDGKGGRIVITEYYD